MRLEAWAASEIAAILRDARLRRAPQDEVVYAAAMFPPERIVCLTEETVETLYLLGEDRRIVGVSGYAVRPARVRREKPRVSAFISADVPENPGARSRSRPDVFRSAGRRRHRAHSPWRRRACVQPARHRRHLRDDPHPRRAGRCERQGGRTGAGAGAAAGASPAARGAIAAPA